MARPKPSNAAGVGLVTTNVGNGLSELRSYPYTAPKPGGLTPYPGVPTRRIVPTIPKALPNDSYLVDPGLKRKIGPDSKSPRSWRRTTPPLTYSSGTPT